MAGIAHFIEHMLFKGTEKRKVGDISKEIEELGGYLNGFTSYEATAYQITLPKENFSKGLEILFDALKNSSFDPLEIEREGQVIIEECKMRDDTPGVRSWKI
jgi:zinc protease